MVPRLLRLHPSTYRRLLRLKKEAEQDGAYRVAKRLHAVVLNSEGHTSSKLAHILKAPRSRVSEWLSLYESHGVDGLLEGQRSGRPPWLSPTQRRQLEDILDSGPVAYGLDTGIWTSPMIAWIIEEEFGVAYHPGHVRKLLDAMNYSVQRPRRVLARADKDAQDRWRRQTYPNLKKNSPGKPGIDLHRRSQLPARFHTACNLEPRGASAGGSSHWRTKEREDPRCDQTAPNGLPLQARHRIQRQHIPGIHETTCAEISASRCDPDSRQRLLPQG
jgi:transposase